MVCDAPGLSVDEQASRVIGRLNPVRGAITTLVKGSREVSAGLMVVRYFNAQEGEEEHIGPPVDGLEKLAGQHQLLGWRFADAVLDFLRDVGAELDVDEYDLARWKANFSGIRSPPASQPRGATRPGKSGESQRE